MGPNRFESHAAPRRALQEKITRLIRGYEEETGWLITGVEWDADRGITITEAVPHNPGD